MTTSPSAGAPAQAVPRTGCSAGPSRFRMTRHFASGSVSLNTGFPVLVVPGSAVSAVICSLWFAALGRARIGLFIE